MHIVRVFARGIPFGHPCTYAPPLSAPVEPTPSPPLALWPLPTLTSVVGVLLRVASFKVILCILRRVGTDESDILMKSRWDKLVWGGN